MLCGLKFTTLNHFQIPIRAYRKLIIFLFLNQEFFYCLGITSEIEADRLDIVNL